MLAIVNGDKHLSFLDLIQVLTGNAYTESGEVAPIFRAYSEGRIREPKLRVHLYLWFDEWRQGGPKMFFPGGEEKHHESVCRYFRVNPAEIKRLPS